MILSDAHRARFRFPNARLASQFGKSGGDTSEEATMEATADAIQQPSCRFFTDNPSSRGTSPQTSTNAWSSGIDEAARKMRKGNNLTYSFIPDRVSTVTVNHHQDRIRRWHVSCSLDELK
ncbi:MAG TPA: hypothetical protein VE977_12915 [Pyrinomonadaceae bacterium]|nr:hypothetical protein [Pyrinomonadaceae bacterium]